VTRPVNLLVHRIAATLLATRVARAAALVFLSVIVVMAIGCCTGAQPKDP
jgi:hypothetical protein